MIILVFGDSFAYGAWDKGGGWVQRLRKYLEKRMEYVLCYNLGVSGDTTRDLLIRFKQEASKRIEKSEKTIIFFSIGMNDSAFLKSKNRNKVSISEFKFNIRKLIDEAMKFSSEIIFLGLTPVNERKTTPVSWNADLFYKNFFIRKYELSIKRVCKARKVNFIGLFNRFYRMNYTRLLSKDGLHLNSRGHKIIFQIVKKHLEQINVLKK